MRNVQQVEYRVADTRVAGKRVQSTQEAKRAIAEMEDAFSQVNRKALVGIPSISLLRWGKSGEICNLSVILEIDADMITLDHVEELLVPIVRNLRQGGYR